VAASILPRNRRLDLADVLVVEPGAGDDRDEVHVQLQGVEHAHEHALALGTAEPRGDLEAGRLDASEVDLGFAGQDAGVGAALVHLHDLDIGHARGSLC
jgi:hypothetical protein